MREGHHEARRGAQALIDVNRIKPSEFTVVFAVISDSTKPIETVLPFFSRMTFVGVARRLKYAGYNVELVKIPVLPVVQAVTPAGANVASQPTVATAVAVAP